MHLDSENLKNTKKHKKKKNCYHPAGKEKLIKRYKLAMM